MKENSHPLIVNLTYLLCSSIEINSVSSWQVEMGKFLPSCSVRAGLWRVAFQLHFPLLNEQLKSDGLPWKKLIYFFSVDSYIYFPFLKEKKTLNKSKNQNNRTQAVIYSVQHQRISSPVRSEDREFRNKFVSFIQRQNHESILVYIQSCLAILRVEEVLSPTHCSTWPVLVWVSCRNALDNSNKQN